MYKWLFSLLDYNYLFPYNKQKCKSVMCKTIIKFFKSQNFQEKKIYVLKKTKLKNSIYMQIKRFRFPPKILNTILFWGREMGTWNEN